MLLGQTLFIRLEPDVANTFPTEESVTKALQSILKELKERGKKE